MYEVLGMFQSSFELTGYITYAKAKHDYLILFQSSFELTGYITLKFAVACLIAEEFQSSFELTGYITG